MRSLKEMTKNYTRHVYKEWTELKDQHMVNTYKDYCRPLITHGSSVDGNLLILGLGGILNIWVRERKNVD